MSDLRERALKAFAVASGLGILPDEEGDPWDEDIANGMDAAIALIRAEVLEEAAKICDGIETKLNDQWRAGYKVCDYTQGASDGANDCAAAIRALVNKMDVDEKAT